MLRVLNGLLSFALFLSVWASTTPAAGNQDYCQYSKRVSLIFVDRTTAYDDTDKELFTTGFGRIVDRLQIGERVLVHTIGGDYVESERTFDQCAPGCPKGGVFDWMLGQCKALEARADQTEFKRKLARNIREMLDNIQDFPRSDIARTISQTSSTVDQGLGGQADSSLASVFVFSDLIENSGSLPWPSITKMQPETVCDRLVDLGIRPNLAEAAVYVFGFGRLHDEARTPLEPKVERRVREFWNAYFRCGGASSVFIGSRLD